MKWEGLRVGVLVAFLIGACSFTVIVGILPVRAGAVMLYVGGSGPGNYTMIQDAVDAAMPGDTVYVYGGNYTENVAVSKSLSLVGEDDATTIIDGGFLDVVVRVAANWVNISGFTIQNGGGAGLPTGIEVTGSQDVRLSNDTIMNNYPGIYFFSSARVSVFDCNLSNDGTGILTGLTSDITMVRNEFFSNVNYAVYLDISTSGVVFSHNDLYSNPNGFTATNAAHLYVRNNTFSPAGAGGIFIDTSRFIDLSGNTFLGAGGIALNECLGASLSDNVMVGSSISLWGSSVESWNSHTIPPSNVANGRPIVYWKNVTGGTLPHDPGEIILANTSDVVVENQSIGNGSVGIELGFAMRSLVTNNTLTSNSAGIYAYSSNDSVITGNHFVNTAGFAIGFTALSNMTIDNNTVSSRLYAIYGDWPGPVKIADNNITDSLIGVYLMSSTRAVVERNEVLSSALYGILLFSCTGTDVRRNNISAGNVSGVYLDNGFANRIAANRIASNVQDGVIIEGAGSTSITDNDIVSNGMGIRLVGAWQSVIHHNNIIGNGVQAYDDSNNLWDNGYPSGGNFWSDYRGVDNYNGPLQDTPGSDGIGDTPHPISGGAGKDDYPLMDMLGPPSAPLTLQATPGDHRVNLTWSPPSSTSHYSILNYLIYRGDSSGSESFLTKVPDVLTYVDPGLPNGERVFYKVSAVTARGEGPRSDETGATPMAVPGPPLNLTVVNNTNKIVLAWSPPSDDGGSPVTNYTVYRGKNVPVLRPYAFLGNVLTYTDTAMATLIEYYYAVSANNSVGEGMLSNQISIRPILITSPPWMVSATAGDRQITVKWMEPFETNGAPATKYSLYRGTVSYGETWLTNVSHTGPVETYVDTGLTNGQTYHYYVTAWCIAGESSESIEVNATPVGPPGAPTGLRAVASDAQISLNWTAPAIDGGSPITNYRLYRGTSPGGEAFLIELVSITNWLDTGLTKGQTYYYKVSAKNAAGEGPNSTEASATPMTVPGAPTAFSAAAGNASATLTWQAPSSNGGSPLTSYRIYRGLSSTGKTLLAEVGIVLIYTDAGLVNGQTYYYEVVAVNQVGEGQRSNEATATPMTVPGQPTALAAVAGDHQVVLTWAPPMDDGGSPVTAYQIHRGTSSGGETFLIEVSSVLTYTDVGLTNGQTYYYQVSAKNSIGEGQDSTEVSGIPAIAPSEPLNLRAAAGDGRVTLTWTAPASDGGSPITNYSIYRGNSSGGETLLAAIGNLLTFTDTDVTNGRAYYYRVTASNGVGEGPRSGEASATPTSGTGTQPSGGKSILEETWFWVAIVAVIIILTLVTIIVLKKRKEGQGKERQSTEEKEEAAEEQNQDE